MIDRLWIALGALGAGILAVLAVFIQAGQRVRRKGVERDQARAKSIEERADAALDGIDDDDYVKRLRDANRLRD